jgi:hypothetical protein
VPVRAAVAFACAAMNCGWNPPLRERRLEGAPRATLASRRP